MNKCEFTVDQFLLICYVWFATSPRKPPDKFRSSPLQFQLIETVEDVYITQLGTHRILMGLEVFGDLKRI